MEHIRIICKLCGHLMFASEIAGLSIYFINRFFNRLTYRNLYPNEEEREKMQKYIEEVEEIKQNYIKKEKGKKKTKKDYIIERKLLFMNAEVVALLFLTVIDDLSHPKHNFIYPEYYVMAIIFLITIICVISVIVKSIKKRNSEN